MNDTIAPAHRLVLHPITEFDPRLVLDDRALIDASRNAWPVVARPAGGGRDGVGLAAGAGFALLLGGITFWSMSGHRQPAAVPPPAAQVMVAPAPGTALPASYASAPPRSFLLPSTAPIPAPPAAAFDRRRAPVMVFDTSAAPAVQVADATAAKPATPSARPSPGIAAGGTDNDQFAARLGGDVETASATALASPSTTITQGTLIPAVLETAIDTDLPGYVRAVVSRDVRAFDGSRVLVPRSSRLIGQYKSGLAAGQTRAYIIWTRLIRPDGASVALGSPSIDFAGRSGANGKVDSHFLKRFGSAVLLSVVGGLSAIGNSSVVLSGGQSAASVAAGRDGAIPPTIKVSPGEPIRVFTAKDLDFAAVDASPDDAAPDATGAP